MTGIPPEVGPDFGVIAVTIGAGITYTNVSEGEIADVPPAVVTATSTVPVPGGLVVVIVPPVFAVIVAVTVPNRTAVAPVKSDPDMVTGVPPDTSPDFGEIPVITGGGRYVNLSDELIPDVPAGVVTVTSTAPAPPPGDIAIIVVLLTIWYEIAVVVPNLTLVAPVKDEPVIVTAVPPEVGPDFGVIAPTVGVYT